MSWQLGVLANGVIGISYIAISVIILRGVHRHGLWQTDRLAVATGAIFASCAAGHLAHFEHLLVGDTTAARASYDAHLAMVDGLTAVIGVLYLSLRHAFGSLLSSGQVFADSARRLDDAARVNDRVLGELVTAQLALEFDRTEDARAAVERALRSATDLVFDLDPEGRLTTGEVADPGAHVGPMHA